MSKDIFSKVKFQEQENQELISQAKVNAEQKQRDFTDKQSAKMKNIVSDLANESEKISSDLRKSADQKKQKLEGELKVSFAKIEEISQSELEKQTDKIVNRILN